MSDPRMIPADEAKNIQALFSSFGNPSNRERKIRDLAATVVAQAEQIERVREAVSRIEKKAENSNTEWREGLKSNQYLEGYTDGLDIAIGRLEKALGVDDE